MNVVTAILISLGICLAAAVLEGLFAGKNVKSFFGKLRLPSFSPPLWLWAAIGLLYYATCFSILYRIFRNESETFSKHLALFLLVIVMAVNAFWNYVFFRLESLLCSFALGAGYSVVTVVLFIVLAGLDKTAALILLPYVLYQIYAFYWGYRLLKLNPGFR